VSGSLVLTSTVFFVEKFKNCFLVVVASKKNPKNHMARNDVRSV
jgi:hypothetical protein